MQDVPRMHPLMVRVTCSPATTVLIGDLYVKLPLSSDGTVATLTVSPVQAVQLSAWIMSLLVWHDPRAQRNALRDSTRCNVDLRFDIASNWHDDFADA